MSFGANDSQLRNTSYEEWTWKLCHHSIDLRNSCDYAPHFPSALIAFSSVELDLIHYHQYS